MAATFRNANTTVSAASTTLVLTKPTGTTTNDLLIAVVSSNTYSTTLPSCLSPAGWLQVGFNFQNTGKKNPSFAFVRVAGGSEPSNYTFTLGGSAENLVGAIVAYSGCAGLDNSATGGAGTSLAGASQNPTIVTTQPSETIVSLWTAYEDASPITVPTGVTSRATITGSASANSVLVGDSVGPTVAGTYQAGIPGGTTSPWVNFTLSLLGSPPPLQPTLTAPTNGSYTDLAAGKTFSWTYNTGGATGGETAYNFRQKISGATTYSYWNAGSGIFQSTDISNSTSSTSVTFSSGLWLDAQTYNWSVASTDANAEGSYASDFTVNGQVAPTVTSILPTATQTTTQYPVITWTPVLAPSTYVTSYRVVTYTDAQHSAGGFVAGTTVGVDDSGVVNSPANTYTVVNELPSGVKYFPYVQLTQNPGGQTTNFTTNAGFTVTTDSPNTPTISAAYGTDGTTGCPRIVLTVNTFDNILSANDSSFEGGLGTTAAIANCSVVQSPTKFEDGLNSCRLSSTASGNMSAGTATGLSGYAVAGSTSYTFRSDYIAGASARSCRTDITWYDSGGTIIGSPITGTPQTSNTSTWTTSTTTANSPSNAAFARLTHNVLATGGAAELHYVDEAGIFPAGNTGWSIGGFVGASSIVVLRSDGLYVRLASTTTPFSTPTPSQIATIYDYEANPGTNYTYTAMVVSGLFASPVSAASNSASVATGLGFWEIDPTNYPSATNAQPTQWNIQNYEQSAAHPVLQQTTVNIVASAMQIPDLSATFSIFKTTIYTAFSALLLSQKTVFISDPYGTSYYFRLAPSPGGMSGGVGNKAKDSQLQASSAGNPYRIIAVSGVGQPRPLV